MQHPSNKILMATLISILSTNLSAEMLKQRGYDEKKHTKTIKHSPIILEEVKPTTDRFEVDYSYDTLSPNNINGNWNTLMMTNYQKIEDGLTMLYQIGLFQRDSEDAGLASIGAYKNWTDTFYTFSQVTSGTSSEYLPSFRVDNDFNFKFGKDKNIVYVLGLTYTNAHDDHSDKIISTGLTYYAPMYNMSYRFFSNQSDPGKVVSYSHTFSAGYGKEKWQWIYLNLSFGNPAYLSTTSNDFKEVKQNAKNIQIDYRKWTSNSTGLYGSLGYFNLSDGYKKNHLKIGYFAEY